MSPAGHLSLSYLAGNLSRRISLPAAVLGGILPDLDFVFIAFSWFNQIHRLVTHTLLFVGLVALVGTLLRLGGRRQAVFAGLLLGGLLHLLVDACMDNNPTNGIGIALLWPFHHGFFSPFNLFPADQNTVGWTDPLRQIKSSLFFILWEIPLYLAAVLLLLRRKWQAPDTH